MRYIFLFLLLLTPVHAEFEFTEMGVDVGDTFTYTFTNSSGLTMLYDDGQNSVELSNDGEFDLEVAEINMENDTVVGVEYSLAFKSTRLYMNYHTMFGDFFVPVNWELWSEKLSQDAREYNSIETPYGNMSGAVKIQNQQQTFDITISSTANDTAKSISIVYNKFSGVLKFFSYFERAADGDPVHYLIHTENSMPTQSFESPGFTLLAILPLLLLTTRKK